MNTISLVIVGTASLLIQSASAQTTETNSLDKYPPVQRQDVRPAEIPTKPVAKASIPIVYARSGKDIAAGQIVRARSAWLRAREAKLPERGQKALTLKAE